MLDVYALFIERNLDEPEFNAMLARAQREKRERIRRFVHFEDAQRAILADALARRALERRGVTGSIRFDVGEFGKPVLRRDGGPHFNVSHSGAWVVCAVDDGPVGIDVEELRAMDCSIGEAAFSRREAQALRDCPEEIRLELFYSIWTLKEAYLKAVGCGLNVPLDSFSVVFDDPSIELFVGDRAEEKDFRLLSLDGKAFVAVCAVNRGEINMIRYTVDQLAREVSSDGPLGHFHFTRSVP